MQLSSNMMLLLAVLFNLSLPPPKTFTSGGIFETDINRLHPFADVTLAQNQCSDKSESFVFLPSRRGISFRYRHVNRSGECDMSGRENYQSRTLFSNSIACEICDSIVRYFHFIYVLPGMFYNFHLGLIIKNN